MARVRLWTLSPAERSILIIYSSELPHSWLRETTASSGPEIPHPRSHQPGPQRPGAWLCPAQLGNRGLNKSWKSIWLPSWRHRPVSQQGSVSCSVSFQASSVPSAHPAPWGCMVEARTQLRQVRSLPPQAFGRIQWENRQQHLVEKLSHHAFITGHTGKSSGALRLYSKWMVLFDRDMSVF